MPMAWYIHSEKRDEKTNVIWQPMKGREGEAKNGWCEEQKKKNYRIEKFLVSYTHWNKISNVNNSINSKRKNVITHCTFFYLNSIVSH